MSRIKVIRPRRRSKTKRTPSRRPTRTLAASRTVPKTSPQDGVPTERACPNRSQSVFVHGVETRVVEAPGLSQEIKGSVRRPGSPRTGLCPWCGRPHLAAAGWSAAEGEATSISPILFLARETESTCPTRASAILLRRAGSGDCSPVNPAKEIPRIAFVAFGQMSNEFRKGVLHLPQSVMRCRTIPRFRHKPDCQRISRLAETHTSLDRPRSVQTHGQYSPL